MKRRQPRKKDKTPPPARHTAAGNPPNEIAAPTEARTKAAKGQTGHK